MHSPCEEEHCSIWEGDIHVQMEGDTDVLVPVNIDHYYNSKTEGRVFDWPVGKTF